MNATAGGAPFVGANASGLSASSSLTPLKIRADRITTAADTAPASPKADNPLVQMSDDQKQLLHDYLMGRLNAGGKVRDRRITRYAKIDRLISTWQKLSQEDSERERIEEMSGKQMALPFNLPVLASHLNDLVSYFSEALAPVSNPFFSSSGQDVTVALLEKLNRDALARDYYGELSLALRALLKYNLGGFHIDWQEGMATDVVPNQKGNYWQALDMYNVMWDPSVKNPKHLPGKGEWAATVSLENRLTLMRNALTGNWVGLENLLANDLDSGMTCKFYKEPAYEATLGEDGQDARTTNARGSGGSVDWSSYGLGVSTDLGAEVDGFEVVDMYCWLVPAQFGLLTDDERKELKNNSIDPETFIELWRFKLLPDKCIVAAVPVLERRAALAGERNEIPYYLSYMTQDQIKEAQRSMMELMRGFQRFASSMYNIYVEGMRKNVWGVKVYDGTMFDMSGFEKGSTVGMVKSKIPGRDVRTGLMTLDSSAGVENALQVVDQALNLKNSFFPTQALPGQVAGMDRAVKSQVAAVVQGASRSMKMLLRLLDASLLLPTRLAAYRNLKRYDKDGLEDMKDEDIAKMVGSGIESMESERVSEQLWNLMHAVIQNAEAMQVYNVPQIMSYLSRLMNLSVDLGQFVRQPTTPPAGATPPGAPPPPPAA